MNIEFNISNIKLVFDIVILIKLSLSTCIGLLIGRERKNQSKSGGARTMAMISIGACMLGLLTIEIATRISPETHNYSRLIAYGLPGVGFLGSGLIIKNRNKIVGLTTASTLLALMPINYCIGLGFYSLGILGAIFAYIILEAKYKEFFRRKK